MDVKRVAEEWEIWDEEEEVQNQKQRPRSWFQKGSISGLKSLARNS